MRRLLLPLLCLAALSSCLWRGYGEILEIHLQVLTQTADKLVDVSAGSQGPPSRGLGEYVYPARRARQFLHQFSKEKDRASYQSLGIFLDRYERMLETVDATRPGASVDVASMRDTVAGLHEIAASIRADLKAGR